MSAFFARVSDDCDERAKAHIRIAPEYHDSGCTLALKPIEELPFCTCLRRDQRSGAEGTKVAPM